MLSLQSIIYVVVALIVGGIIYWLLDWALRTIAPPEPFRKVAQVVLVLGAVLFVIVLLLRLVGVNVIAV